MLSTLGWKHIQIQLIVLLSGQENGDALIKAGEQYISSIVTQPATRQQLIHKIQRDEDHCNICSLGVDNLYERLAGEADLDHLLQSLTLGPLAGKH